MQELETEAIYRANVTQSQYGLEAPGQDSEGRAQRKLGLLDSASAFLPGLVSIFVLLGKSK